LGIFSRYLPDARAVRKGARLVMIRHGDREARLEDDGGAFCIRFRAGDRPCPALSIAIGATRTRLRRWRGLSPASSTQSSRAWEIRKSDICKEYSRSRCAAKRGRESVCDDLRLYYRCQVFAVA
jgi:hypothetical protein